MSNYPQQDFATILKMYRAKHGLSQREMAKQLGTIQQTYRNYEAGRLPRVDFVQKYKEVTGIDLTKHISQVYFNAGPDNDSLTISTLSAENKWLRELVQLREKDIAVLKNRIQYLEKKFKLNV